MTELDIMYIFQIPPISRTLGVIRVYVPSWHSIIDYN
jgi:hypothetical protein